MTTIHEYEMSAISPDIRAVAEAAYLAGVRHQNDPAHLPREWQDQLPDGRYWPGVCALNLALAILGEPDHRPVAAYVFAGREYRTLAAAKSALRAWLRRTREVTYRGGNSGPWAPEIEAIGAAEPNSPRSTMLSPAPTVAIDGGRAAKVS